jgi:hypothetical protein
MNLDVIRRKQRADGFFEPHYNRVMERLKRISGCTRNNQLAELLLIDIETFSNLNKSRTIPYQQIVETCRQYNYSIDYLFFGKRGSVHQSKVDELHEIIKRQAKMLSVAHFRANSTPIAAASQHRRKQA